MPVNGYLVRQSLQFHLPRPVPRPIAAPAVGLEQPPLGVRVAIAPLIQPPAPDRGGGKGRRLMGCPDPDIPSVPPLIVDAVGDTHADRIPAKIMIQHLATLATVAPARILEIADQLFLFPIDAEHGPALSQKPPPLLGQITELTITVGMMGSGLTFAVGTQQKLLLPQQPSDGISSDVKSLTSQGPAQCPQRLMRPLQLLHRIACRGILHQSFQCGQEGRVFFFRAAFALLPCGECGSPNPATAGATPLGHVGWCSGSTL
jgi:hypothetical protein